tara:strand:- start:342 stop:704 length:363 start_codon:yes stop_codon:yes gene_type:complete
MELKDFVLFIKFLYVGGLVKFIKRLFVFIFMVMQIPFGDITGLETIGKFYDLSRRNVSRFRLAKVELGLGIGSLIGEIPDDKDYTKYSEVLSEANRLGLVDYGVMVEKLSSLYEAIERGY